MAPKARISDRRLILRLLQQVGPYRYKVLALLLIELLAAPLALLKPVPLSLTVDSVLGSEPLPRVLAWLVPGEQTPGALLLVLALLLGVALIGHLRDLYGSLLRTYTAEHLILGFRAQLFRHIQRLSLSYHDRTGIADSIYRLQYDAAALQSATIDAIIPLVVSAVTLLSMLVVTFRVDWQLALIALAVSPVLFALAGAYRKRLRRQSREVKKLESAALAVAQESLAALRVVKAFGQEDREEQRFFDHSTDTAQARIRYSLAEGGLGLLLGMTTAAGTAAVLYVGVRHIQAGTLTLGEMLLVMGYLAQLYEPLKTISRKVAGLQSHLASAERAFAVLDEAPDVPQRTNARRLARARHAIAFHHVSFGYDRARQVLRNVSFEVPAGTRVGIVGKTGAGKSTLVSLMTRFYDPSAGVILLDGVDLRAYRLADLRNQFAIVQQEPVLFSVSIAENIAYARPGASEREIIQAARAANAHEFIARLPEGYGTQVGERGLLLSGGERQRIALARAFLRDAPILILDEPTSSIDMRTEASILAAMERLVRGRTAFLIAHRLTTVENCDLLLVLEEGRLVETTRDVSARVRQAMEAGGMGPHA